MFPNWVCRNGESRSQSFKIWFIRNCTNYYCRHHHHHFFHGLIKKVTFLKSAGANASNEIQPGYGCLPSISFLAVNPVQTPRYHWMKDSQLNTEERIKISIKIRKKKTHALRLLFLCYSYKQQLQLCIQVISFYINKMFFWPFLVTEALKKK